MKSNKENIFLFLTILICVTVSSCTTTKNYKTMKQPPVESKAITVAVEFKVRPINFSAIKSENLGYSNAEDWKAELEPIQQAFADAFGELSEKAKKDDINPFAHKYNFANITNKKVIIVKQDEIVTSGIVVNIVIKEIVLKWKYFDRKPDEYLCSITFTDAANGQELFSDIVCVNSLQGAIPTKSAIPSASAGPVGPSFGPVSVGISFLAVTPEMKFSNRLQNAVYNMAEMLAEIMANGKIEPVKN